MTKFRERWVPVWLDGRKTFFILYGALIWAVMMAGQTDYGKKIYASVDEFVWIVLGLVFGLPWGIWAVVIVLKMMSENSETPSKHDYTIIDSDGKVVGHIDKKD